MKFMKLGSKPDSFLTDGDNSRYVATEVATDIVITVGNVKFYLHKSTLLSKCSRLQKLFATTNEDTDTDTEIQFEDIPGGPAAFEICAKFCYGITVTLNAYNVAAARCAAEYLEMYESTEKGNLIYKIDVFLNSSLLHNWKDSIIVLRSTGSLLPWSDELKLISHCLDSIASKASVDSSEVDWSYTYNRSKLPSENAFDPHWTSGRKHQMVPKDWWVDDLCELDIELYKRAIVSIKSRAIVSDSVIGEALSTYAFRRIPGFSKGRIQCSDVNQSLVKTIVWLLPAGKGSVPCSFLLKLLKVATSLECGDCEKVELMKRIGQQLEEATVTDLLIRAPAGEAEIYDVAVVMTLLEEYLLHIQSVGTDLPAQCELPEISTPGYVSDPSKVMVAKLIDGYLAEVARDTNLPLSKFVDLAEKVSGFPRPSHDGLYRGIDMYLKGHPGISKSERKRLCRLMDCKKLSREARMHAVQNERLPLRIIVQVLFFEQVRATTSSSGSSTPELHGSLRLLLPGGSNTNRSSRSPAAEDWDSAANTVDTRALRGELASLRLGGGLGLGGSSSDRHGSVVGAKVGTDKVAENKVKGMVMSKMLTKLWSGKERSGEYSSSDTSESPGSGNAEETNHSRGRTSVS